MQLSQTAEYALRTMACLARNEGRGPLRAKDIAPVTGIPLPFLSKILRRLTTAGLLTSARGHGGGFALARPAEEIIFAEVLRAVDCEPVANHCVFGWAECDESDPCPLHSQWVDLKRAIDSWAQNRTLADIQRDLADSSE